ncbi:MAG: hypothetical protein Q4G71_04375, partial [Pseudomonadota bacterium]|nr:hypothetical protein [Pseudomonadota bacterium]
MVKGPAYAGPAPTGFVRADPSHLRPLPPSLASEHPFILKRQAGADAGVGAAAAPATAPTPIAQAAAQAAAEVVPTAKAA